MNNNLPGYLLDKMLSSSTRFMSMMARVAPMYRVLAAAYKNNAYTRYIMARVAPMYRVLDAAYKNNTYTRYMMARVAPMYRVFAAAYKNNTYTLYSVHDGQGGPHVPGVGRCLQKHYCIS